MLFESVSCMFDEMLHPADSESFYFYTYQDFKEYANEDYIQSFHWQIRNCELIYDSNKHCFSINAQTELSAIIFNSRTQETEEYIYAQNWGSYMVDYTYDTTSSFRINSVCYKFDDEQKQNKYLDFSIVNNGTIDHFCETTTIINKTTIEQKEKDDESYISIKSDNWMNLFSNIGFVTI